MIDQVSLDCETSIKSLSRPTLYRRVSRALQIAKHYSWLQMARRVVHVITRKCATRSYPLRNPRLLTILPPTPATWQGIFDIVANKPEIDRKAKFAELKSGTFRLLNREVNLGNPIDWDRALQETHLWRFQLQYHEFLLPYLALEEDEQTALWSFLEHWLNSFATNDADTHSDAWHPYCISRRLTVWIWILTCGKPPERLRQRLLGSLVDQTIYLSEHLETDLGGNHLLENLHALKLVSTILPDSLLPQRVSKCASRLESILGSQLLSSGEHFERAPMYHCHILANLLVAIGAQESFSSRDTTSLRKQAGRMLTFLEQICHPDGEIPLFGDSGFGEALSTAAIRSIAKHLGIGSRDGEWLESLSDYWVTRTGEDFLIVDRGVIAAPNLPAHGHCDLLGFEASIGGKRWFVDSGNFDYESGSMRSYCRSAVAHNVVTINREDTAEVWSKFRMGDRPSILNLKQGSNETHRWMSAVHNGFRRNGIPRALRFFAASSRVWLVGDHLPSSSKTQIEGWLHLAPCIEIRRLEEDQFALQFGDHVRYLGHYGCRRVSIVDGWFCQSFGDRKRNRVICYEKDAENRFFGWLLTSEQIKSTARSQSAINFTLVSGECFSVPILVE